VSCGGRGPPPSVLRHAASRAIWFWANAGVLFLLITASAAPAPLYRVYQ
jgi:hypothetical protein